MTSYDPDIAENIRKSRQLADLSLEEVASLSGISERRLARIENGTSDLYVSELLSLCRAKSAAISLLIYPISCLDWFHALMALGS